MRSLVLLLTSSHTVRIALRDWDLERDPDGHVGREAVRLFLAGLQAVAAVPSADQIVFSYIENTVTDPNLGDDHEFSRIGVVHGG